MGRDIDKRRAACRAWKAAHRSEQLAYNKAYDATRRDRSQRAETDKAYYNAHRDEIAAKKKAAYLADPAPTIARCKKYRAANRSIYLAACRAYGAAYYAAHRDERAVYASQYKVTHLKEHAESEGRRRARKRNTQVEPIDLMQVLRDSKGVCGICHKPLDLFGIDFDHIVPLSKGGTHTRDNIQPSHSRCNRVKGAKAVAS